MDIACPTCPPRPLIVAWVASAARDSRFIRQPPTACPQDVNACWPDSRQSGLLRCLVVAARHKPAAREQRPYCRLGIESGTDFPPESFGQDQILAAAFGVGTIETGAIDGALAFRTS